MANVERFWGLYPTTVYIVPLHLIDGAKFSKQKNIKIDVGQKTDGVEEYITSKFLSQRQIPSRQSVNITNQTWNSVKNKNRTMQKFVVQNLFKMKNIELSIPSMQSAHCQARVNGAIAAIEGIKVEKLEAEKLSVAVESDEVRKELVETIEKAGYKVEGDDSKKDSSPSSGCCTN